MSIPLLATAITPAILIPGFFFPFVTVRNLFFRFCIELALIAGLILWGRQSRRVVWEKDPVLKWFAIYLVGVSLAALLGAAPMHSFFGDFERMGGVWAWVHLLLFYVLLRATLDTSGWVVLFRIAVLTADVVTLWGASEFLPRGIRNPAFRTTLANGSLVGNAGLLAPYLLLALALSLWLVLTEKKRILRIIAGASAVVLLGGLASTLNRAAQLGLILGVIAGVLVLYRIRGERKLLRYAAVPAAMVVAIAGVLTLLAKGAPQAFAHFFGKWRGFVSAPVDYSRTIQWKAAVAGFADHPVWGYGPENYQVVVSRHFNPEIYSVLQGGIFDRVHNAWLESLATSGLLGTLPMLLLWVAAVATLREGWRRRKLESGEVAIFAGALAAYAVYLTFWFFDINSAILWVCILAFVSSRTRGNIAVSAGAPLEEPHARRSKIFAGLFVALTVLAALFHGLIPLIAARNLAVAAGNAPFTTKLVSFEKAMDSPAPQTEHTFPMYYRFLREYSRLYGGARSNGLVYREFDFAFKRGMIEGSRSIARNPRDDRPYLDNARFSLLAFSFYRDPVYLLRARGQLREAAALSPLRPDTRLLLATTYLALADTVRGAAQLDSSLRLAPEYSATWFYAALLASDRGSADSAAKLLVGGLRRKFIGDERVYAKTADALRAQGKFDLAALLLRTYLERAYACLEDWGPNPIRLTPLAERMADELPILYLAAGNPHRAVLAARAFAAVRPAARDVSSQFQSDVTTGRAQNWSGRQFLWSDSTDRKPGTVPGSGG